jgi:hypothetical protein
VKEPSLLTASELQLVLLEDMADADRDTGLSPGLSVYGLIGPLALGGNSISDDCATSGVPYNAEAPPVRGEWPAGGLCGNSCLEKPGVSAVVDCELSVRKFPNKSPPLPELTVICGGRRGAREPSEAIMRVSGGGTDYVQGEALIYRMDFLIGYPGDDWNV